MTRCSWCGVPVDDRQAGIAGNHRDFMACIEALKKQRKALLQELIDERVITARLTEQLEQCEVCPAADEITDYEEQKGAIDGIDFNPPL